MIRGELQRQQRAHRQAADEQMVDLAGQFVRGALDAGVPVAPAGGEQVFDIAAMAGQLHAVHRVAGVVEALAEQAHFHRRAGQAMDQQHAAAVTFEEKFGWLDHGTLVQDLAAGRSQMMGWE